MPTLAPKPRGRAKDLALASAWMTKFREMGYNPLPSHEEKRHPDYPFREYWESPVPQRIYDEHPTTLFQVMTGRFWGLIVFDVELAALGEWDRLLAANPRTPVSWRSRSGGGGLHAWFEIPRDWPKPMTAGPIWVGEGKHNRIDRLCDRSLVVAPPSIHPKTKKPYVWERGCSPLDMPRPARCPNWLLEYPTVHEEERRKRPKRFRDSSAWAHLPKIGLARTWGVKFTGNCSKSGWHECHAIDRDDANPSAAVHEESGYYRDLGGDGAGLTFPELAVALRIYTTIEEALDDLRRAGGRKDGEGPHRGSRGRLGRPAEERSP